MNGLLLLGVTAALAISWLLVGLLVLQTVRLRRLCEHGLRVPVIIGDTNYRKWRDPNDGPSQRLPHSHEVTFTTSDGTTVTRRLPALATRAPNRVPLYDPEDLEGSEFSTDVVYDPDNHKIVAWYEYVAQPGRMRAQYRRVAGFVSMALLFTGLGVLGLTSQ